MTDTLESSARARVLLVEDDDDIRVDLAELLQYEGFDVECAAHGAEALAVLRARERPDVILLDLMMPVMDGWGFRNEQLADPALAAIPVLLLTAAGVDDSRMPGIAGRIRKPLELEHLFAEIHRLSGTRQ